jgi:DNA primase catalytic subunit
MEDFDFNQYYQNHQVDISWLEKPSQHEFRWRCIDGSWRKSKRRVSSIETFRKSINQDNPTDIYFSTSSWLDPVNLPRLSDETRPHPILLNHLIVFDIDFTPLSLENLEQARITTLKLHNWIEKNYYYELLSISFSGSKGFHLFYNDLDRTLFSIENAKDRENAVKAERNKLLQEVLLAGFKVDPRITADTRRIIRLPGSIHGKTGLLCHRIGLEILETNVESWINKVPSYYTDLEIPKTAKAQVNKNKKPIEKQFSNEQIQITEHSYMIEVSNHLPGTKDRSALIFWTPYSWGTGTECFNQLSTLIEMENLGFCAIFSDGERILFICPESITRAKVIKILTNIGLEKLANTLEIRGHYWVRISGIMGDDGIWHNEPKFISIINDKYSHATYSKSHLTLLTKLGVAINKSQHENLSGNSEPSIRMVIRD